MNEKITIILTVVIVNRSSGKLLELKSNVYVMDIQISETLFCNIQLESNSLESRYL